MRSPLVFILLLLAVALVGCKGPSVVGKWKGSAEPSASDSNNPMAGLATSMAKSLVIEFKSDNTFDMTMIIPVSGTWTQSGSTITLVPKTVLGVEASKSSSGSKPMVFTLSPDGQTLTPQDAGDSKQGSFTFVRA